MTRLPERPEEEELVRRAVGGDDDAFGELVRRHQESVFRLARRYLGDADEALEAAHEAFLAAWRALPRYDAARPFGPWLRTIAINKARDRGRRRAVRRAIFGARPVEDTVAVQAHDPGAGAEADLMQQERLRVLDQAIAALPAKLKEALLLTAIEGLSQQDAGAMLGVSAKTIETRAYRARKLLAARFSRDEA